MADIVLDGSSRTLGYQHHLSQAQASVQESVSGWLQLSPALHSHVTRAGRWWRTQALDTVLRSKVIYKPLPQHGGGSQKTRKPEEAGGTAALGPLPVVCLLLTALLGAAGQIE